MILLALKMETEYIFRVSYPLFFEEEEGKPEVIFFLTKKI